MCLFTLVVYIDFCPLIGRLYKLFNKFVNLDYTNCVKALCMLLMKNICSVQKNSNRGINDSRMGRGVEDKGWLLTASLVALKLLYSGSVMSCVIIEL